MEVTKKQISPKFKEQNPPKKYKIRKEKSEFENLKATNKKNASTKMT